MGPRSFVGDQVGHGRDILSNEDDIIYIDQKKHNVILMKKEKGVIQFGLMEAESKECGSKLIELGLICLFKAIDEFLKFTNMVRILCVNKTMWLLHVYLLSMNAMKESIKDIKFSQVPFEMYNNGQYASDGGSLTTGLNVSM